MDSSTAIFLGLDGITNGAVYALVALSLVLVYTTTRVVNVAQGDFLTFGALAFASLAAGTLTPLLYVVLGIGAVCLVIDLRRARAYKRSLLAPLVRYLAAAIILCALVFAASHSHSMPLQMLAALLLVAAMGPLVYQLTVEPNPAMPPREAILEWDQGYDRIDLDACAAEIREVVATHLEPEEARDAERRYG